MQTVAVPACSCAMAWMRARSSRSSSSKALFLRHPKNPAQTLGISVTGGCPPRCLAMGQPPGQGWPWVFFQPHAQETRAHRGPW